MTTPFHIPYGRQTIDADDIDAVVEALTSDFMTQGPKIAEFEEAMAVYHGCRFAVAFSNGTAALHGSYHASRIQKGEEFITSPITFAASANGGLYVGATPKFVDVNIADGLMNLDLLEGSITSSTKVVTPVSYAGYPVDIESVRNITDRHGLTVIHDAAHAIGARRNGRSITEGADMTILSFHPVKHVATGEGGMVLTDNETLYRRLQLFRTHGITRDPDLLEENHGAWYYEMQELGFNYRITDLQCALGLSQLGKLDHSLYRRNVIARYYREHLSKLDWLDLPMYPFSTSWLDDPNYSELENLPSDLHAYHLFPILVKDPALRKPLFDYLRSSGIFVQVHYIPVHTLPYYRREFGLKKGDFPLAEAFYAREISLPMFPALTKEQLEYIVGTLVDFSHPSA